MAPYDGHVVWEIYIVENDTDEEVQRNAEEVHDGGAHLLGHMGCPHLHHAWPEQAHAELKHAESYQLDLALERDTCRAQPVL